MAEPSATAGEYSPVKQVCCLVSLFVVPFPFSCFIRKRMNLSIVDFFVKAKPSTVEGFSTNEGFFTL